MRQLSAEEHCDVRSLYRSWQLLTLTTQVSVPVRFSRTAFGFPPSRRCSRPLLTPPSSPPPHPPGKPRPLPPINRHPSLPHNRFRRNNRPLLRPNLPHKPVLPTRPIPPLRHDNNLPKFRILLRSKFNPRLSLWTYIRIKRSSRKYAFSR